MQNVQMQKLIELGVIKKGAKKGSKKVKRLIELGVIISDITEHRISNIGSSNYSAKMIQPWAIWQDWGLDPWDADIVKRVLRTKSTDSRVEDYRKIIHICDEKISQSKRVSNNEKHTIPPYRVITPHSIMLEWDLWFNDCVVIKEIYHSKNYENIKIACKAAIKELKNV